MGEVEGEAEAEVVRTDDLALVHGDAARQLGRIFREQDAGQKAFGLAEQVVREQPLPPCAHLPEQLRIGGDPGEAMDHVLFPVQCLAVQAAVHRSEVPGAQGRGAEIVLRPGGRLLDQACDIGVTGSDTVGESEGHGLSFGGGAQMQV